MEERMPPQVGAPDPERETSPVADETDEDFPPAGMQADDRPVCLFNGVVFQDGEFVCSGADLLRCDCGIWIREGSCDPDHP
ncbi:hypothetical protein BMS3Bbin12_02052 [bacterium BMS3Bbin12]|nr:hypothetical protein BMS3Abin12_00477 [bacterium BMS3Abin12]GBE48861.1 hypothetical protein BMS3Bbin12_02052 [bacterium BMS3Bbin12]GBE49765.1 hypothetical protein BMS3Bbin13_00688 [bacterium BMS3Bbin13]HDJ86738.1 hypothetical protein [Chromatiales bacterium]HDK02547.1 hypothetical protein [Gammaproteobacteria bacterium]